MKLPTYTATEALKRYPANERFVVYKRTHQQLLKEDAVYRKRCNAYFMSLGCMIIVLFIGLFPICLSDNVGLKTVIAGFSAIAFVPATIYLAFRHQKYMNARIGEALQKTS